MKVTIQKSINFLKVTSEKLKIDSQSCGILCLDGWLVVGCKTDCLTRDVSLWIGSPPR